MNVRILGYFKLNLDTDIVCQALSVFKIAILLLIVVTGTSDTVVFCFRLNTILIRMGCAQRKNSRP
jgi:hypothetical protein